MRTAKITEIQPLRLVSKKLIKRKPVFKKVNNDLPENSEENLKIIPIQGSSSGILTSRKMNVSKKSTAPMISSGFNSFL